MKGPRSHRSRRLPRREAAADRPTDRAKGPTESPLEKTADAGFLALVFVAPLILGGRHPWGRFAVVALVALIACAWLARQVQAARPVWRRTGAEWLLLAGLGLIVLQLAPLSPAALQRVAPATQQFLSAWTADAPPGARQGVWTCASLSPEATRSALSMYLAYALLFMLAAQRIGSLKDVERFVRWIAWAAAAIAAIGMAQYFAGNGKFLWVYEHPFRDTYDSVKGPFVNRNHFAHFLALGIGPLVWWARSLVMSKPAKAGVPAKDRWAPRRDPTQWTLPFAMLCLAGVGLAGLLSLSRGGILAMLVAGAATLGCLAAASLAGRKTLIAAAVVGAVTVAGIGAYGHHAVTGRLESLGAGGSLSSASPARLKIWRAVLDATPDFLCLGAGFGSHRDVYPRYYHDPRPVDFSHAESGYLQVLLEGGIPATILLALGLVVCGFWGVRALRMKTPDGGAALACALVPGLAASAVHSLVDFVWYIPACMSITILLAACLCRLGQLSVESTSTSGAATPESRFSVLAACTLLAVFGVSAIGAQAGPALAAPDWDNFRRSAKNVANVMQGDPETLERRMELLERVVRRDSNSATAHLHLAALWLKRFELEQQASENPMPLAQIREAAEASQFTSREALDQWLAAAIGPRADYLRQARWHSRRAARLSPFQGEAYIYLADLTFLDGAPRSANAALIEQALEVRPHSAVVQIAAGHSRLVAGDIDQAIKAFRGAFRQGGEFQRHVIDLFAPRGAEFFISQFEPDVPELQLLNGVYSRVGAVEEAAKVRERLLQTLYASAEVSQGAAAARLWRQCAEVHASRNEREQAVQCAAKAVAAAPEDFASRRSYADLLLKAGHYAQAVAHLEWCLQHYPENEKLAKDLALARSQASLDGPAQASGAHPAVR